MLSTPENHPIEIATIGVINFKDNINEAEISNKNKRFNTKNIGEYKVEIYGGEGSIPHMHIYNSDKSFETCVCVYSNNYFSHGGKYSDKFTSKQCKEFNKWLKELNTKSAIPMTNWEMVMTMWEGNNGNDCKFPENRKIRIQPHYEDMINYKDI